MFLNFIFTWIFLFLRVHIAFGDDVTKEDLESLNSDYKINAAGANGLYPVQIKQATMVFQVLNELIDIVDPTFQLTVLQGDRLLDANRQAHLHHHFRHQKHDEKFKKLVFDAFEKEGSDKSYHQYHGLYALIFKSLGPENKLRTLEIGMGTNDTTKVSHMFKGRPGASQHAFALFLPNAKIYGADIDSNILFQTDRISTTYVNQLDSSSFIKLNENFGNEKFDLIIDDALHSSVASFNQLIFALKNLKSPGYIVVEDIPRDFFRQYRLFDYILRSKSSDPRILIDSFMWSGNDRDFLYVLSTRRSL